MTVPPGGGSRPIGADPTAALPTAGAPVPPRDVRPAHAGPPLVPVVAPPAAAAAVPGTSPDRVTRDRVSRDRVSRDRVSRDRVSRDGGERRRRKAPLAWLPWALLAALLTLLALMLLAGTLAGAERATRAAAGDAPERPAPAGPGTLQVGDADLLASPDALGRLASVQGQQAVGRDLRVQSVVADEGFWVGSSARQRLFVYLTPEARASSGESGFQVRQGQTVDVNGRIIGTSAGDPELFGVTDAEGARQLTAQRAYLRATQVRLSS